LVNKAGGKFMLIARFRLAAGIAALLAVAPAFAGDNNTVLLGGVGSMARPTNAAVTTLQGNAANDADTVPVCCWWRRAYACAPVCYPAPVVCAAPVYYTPPTFVPVPAPATAPPPAAAYYRALPPATDFAAAPRPSIVVGFQGRLFGGSIALRPGIRAAAPAYDYSPAPTERMPQPRSDDSYRYDGGPNRPVPMPTPDLIPPTDPVPMTVPALHRVGLDRTPKKVAYPAYGDRPATTPRPTVVVDPLLVKRTAN
jgi:hypothetical protein